MYELKKYTQVELDDDSSIPPNAYAKLKQQIHKLQGENKILKRLWPYSKNVNDAEISQFIHGQKENYPI